MAAGPVHRTTRPRAAPRPAAERRAGAGNGARTSLTDVAYDKVRQRILDNVYPPGHRVLEQELAEDLGVSRTPLREAMVRLRNEGMIEIVPRHGIRVLPLSATDMKEIYETLTALESMAAELAARRRPGAAEVKPLEDASRDMARALRANDLEGWARADEQFHRSLIDLCGNRLLKQTVLNFWDRAHRARMFTLRLRPKPVHSTDEHRELVERIRAGDAAGAFNVTRAHRERGSRELLGIIEHYGLQQL
jgi:DNA-binding GntR family transcriptional regulator